LCGGLVGLILDSNRDMKRRGQDAWSGRSFVSDLGITGCIVARSGTCWNGQLAESHGRLTGPLPDQQGAQMVKGAGQFHGRHGHQS
jgi:hypothetical protein